MLRQISENVIVCLDGDNAGLKAANRITDIMAAEHLNVKCVLIPNNQDPDEYINEYGAEKMQEVLDNALDYIDFQINYLAKDVDFAKTDQKAKFVKNALKLLEKLSTNSERQVYLKHIKDLSGVPLDILQRDMLDLPLNKGKEDDTSFNERYEVEDASNKAIKFILASMLQKKDYAYKYDISNFLRNNSYIRLYSLLNTKREKGEDLKIAMLFDEFDMDNEPNIVDIIEYNFEQNGNNEKYYEECLWTLKEKDLKEKQAKLNEEYNNSSSLDRRREILMELNDISKKLKTKSLED